MVVGGRISGDLGIKQSPALSRGRDGADRLARLVRAPEILKSNRRKLGVTDGVLD